MSAASLILLEEERYRRQGLRMVDGRRLRRVVAAISQIIVLVDHRILQVLDQEVLLRLLRRPRPLLKSCTSPKHLKRHPHWPAAAVRRPLLQTHSSHRMARTIIPTIDSCYLQALSGHSSSVVIRITRSRSNPVAKVSVRRIRFGNELVHSNKAADYTVRAWLLLRSSPAHRITVCQVGKETMD